MLNDAEVQPTIGVTDLDQAAQFYGGVLGLSVEKENPQQIIYNSGSGHVVVYKTEAAGTNKATYATWEVEDIEDVVSALVDDGVSFEHYDGMAGVTREGEIHLFEQEKAAWFTDPDGNILCLHAVAET